MKLFHGGNITTINDEGRFRGAFASPEESHAGGQGDYLHTIEVDDSNILTNFELNYSIEHEETFAAFSAVCEEMGIDPESDIVWEAVIEDKNVYEMDEDEVLTAFVQIEVSEASFDGQMMRGQVAKRLGYQAVEMSDEYGTSYLIVHGEFERVVA